MPRCLGVAKEQPSTASVAWLTRREERSYNRIMNEKLPANFRVCDDVKYGMLRLVDIPAETAANAPWFNQTLTTVNDAVVRLGIFEGEFPWHKHTEQDEFFLVLDGEIFLDIEGAPPVQ